MKPKSVLRAVACTALFLALAAAPPGAGGANAQGAAGQGPLAGPSEGRIVVSAEGRASAAPDMATVTVGVVAEAETAEEASAAMSAAAREMLDRLAAEGIAPRDLQTSGLSLSPQWRRGAEGDRPPEITGYQAETTVTARVRELGKLGAVLDAAVQGGANQFRGLSFGLADPQPVEDAARRAAVAEAARRAALFAEAAGVELGRLVRLEEEGGPGPRPLMRAEMAMSDAASQVPVAEGELDVTARVRLVYEIAGE